MRKDVDVINTAVASLVAGTCSRKQEVGRVIDSCLGGVACWGGGGEGEQEKASWVLWLDGATDREVQASEHLKPLLLVPGDPVHDGGGHRDVRPNQQVCKQSRTTAGCKLNTHPSCYSRCQWSWKFNKALTEQQIALDVKVKKEDVAAACRMGRD